MKKGAKFITSALTSLVLVGAFLAAAAGSASAAPLECFGKKPTIVGTNGADVLKGTAEVDVIVGRGGDDKITALGGDDWICGGSGRDKLYGGPGRDFFSGGTGNDQLFGQAGDDVLWGELGDDTYDGRGSGWDVAWFSHAPNGVRADLSTGEATGEGSDRLIGIEALTGSRFDDTLVGDRGVNQIEGLEGDDAIDGGGGLQDDVSYWHSTGPVTVDLTAGSATGGEGTDTLTGIETVNGGMFDDTLTGDANPNHMWGWDGNDTISSLDGDDNVYGMEGNDTIDAGNGTDLVDGGSGSDSCLNGEDVQRCES